MSHDISSKNMGDVKAATPESGMLWYCCRCTKLILPPGTGGMISEQGDRYCSACATFEVNPLPATPIASPCGQKLAWRTKPRPEYQTPAQPLRSTSRKYWVGAGVGVSAAATFVVAYFSFVNANKAVNGGLAAKENVAAQKAQLNEAKSDAPIKVAARLSRVESTVPAESTAGLRSTLAETGVAQKPNERGDAPVRAAGKPTLQNEANARAAELEKKLGAVAALIAVEKFSEAQAQLDAIAADNANAPWWPEWRDRVVRARLDLRAKFEAYDGDAREAAQRAKTAPSETALNELEGAWKARLARGEMTAQPAAHVLESVRAARERIGRNEAEQHCAALAGPLEKLEKRAKAPLAKPELDAALSSLQELKTKLVADPQCAELFAERWASVNFDLGCESNAERTILKVQPAGSAQTELFYDFKNGEQAAAWKFERGGGAGDARMELDGSAKALVLHIGGEQHADARAGKTAPSAQIPFYMAGAAWTLEADARVIKAKPRDKKDQNPCYGILVSDGGKNSVRFSGKEARKGELSVMAHAGEEHEASAKLSGKQDDRLHLRIVGGGEMLAFSAESSGKSATVGRARINFEPKFIGLYVETFAKDEDARVAFENVKLTGTLDKDKIKAAIGAWRNGEIEAQRAQLINAAKSAK